jgi:hypothetical protein
VVEATPARRAIVRCEGVVARANHYESAAIVAAAKQAAEGTVETNSFARSARAARLLRHDRGIAAPAVERILRDRHGGPRMAICQGRPGGMTIDAFYCLPRTRELWLARGVPSRHAFLAYPCG